MPCIIGRKIEMTQKFKNDGTVVAVTLVKAEPNVVAQIRDEEKDGYKAIQLATEKAKQLTKSEAGHLHNLPALKTLREFRISASTDLKRGDVIKVDVFTPGMKVDVVGFSKGRGFTGVMKRHGFKCGKATHGNKDQQRMGGSIGSQRQGKVIKGQRMAGHSGDERVTVKNLEIIFVDEKQNILAIKGALPGARGGLLLIRSNERINIWQ